MLHQGGVFWRPVRSREVPNPGVDIGGDGEVNRLGCTSSCLIRVPRPSRSPVRDRFLGTLRPEPSTTTTRVFFRCWNRETSQLETHEHHSETCSHLHSLRGQSGTWSEDQGFEREYCIRVSDTDKRDCGYCIPLSTIHSETIAGGEKGPLA